MPRVCHLFLEPSVQSLEDFPQAPPTSISSFETCLNDYTPQFSNALGGDWPVELVQTPLSEPRSGESIHTILEICVRLQLVP